MTGPYTPGVEAARSEPETTERDRFEMLRAEATAAIGSTANALRAVLGQYREAYARHLAYREGLRDELDAAERAPRALRAVEPTDPTVAAAIAAEAGAEDARRRALRYEGERLSDELGSFRSTLAKLEVAERTLEHTWLFLESGDGATAGPADGAVAQDDLAMRIIGAQESERARLAQEIHDGPAQALSNAIFQVDYIERITPTDPTGASVELRTLREMLRRELASVRDEINQLRPPLPEDGGLETALGDAATRLGVLTDATVEVRFDAPGSLLDAQQRTVALRVAQEALHNVRKHAAATEVTVRSERAPEDGSYILEIRDDGRGFDVGAVAARGRRNFGLQFMRERAELIGGRFDVRSRPGDGTVVRLAIPISGRTGAEETT